MAPRPKSPRAMLDGSGMGLISKPLGNKPGAVPNNGAGGAGDVVSNVVPSPEEPNATPNGFEACVTSASAYDKPAENVQARIWKVIVSPAAYGAGILNGTPPLKNPLKMGAAMFVPNPANVNEPNG